MDKESYLSQFQVAGRTDILFSDELFDAHNSYINDIHGVALGIYVVHDIQGTCLHNKKEAKGYSSGFKQTYENYQYQWHATNAPKNPEGLQEIFNTPCYLSTNKYSSSSKSTSSPGFPLRNQYVKYSEEITEDIFNQFVNYVVQKGGKILSGWLSYDKFKTKKYLMYNSPNTTEFGCFERMCVHSRDMELNIFAISDFHIKYPAEKPAVVESKNLVIDYLKDKYIQYNPGISESLFTKLVCFLRINGITPNEYSDTSYEDFKKYEYLTTLNAYTYKTFACHGKSYIEAEQYTSLNDIPGFSKYVNGNSEQKEEKFTFLGKYFKYTPDISEDIYYAIVNKLFSLGWKWSNDSRDFSAFKHNGYLIYYGKNEISNDRQHFNLYPGSSIAFDDIPLDPYEFLGISKSHTSLISIKSIAKETPDSDAEFTFRHRYIKYTPEITIQVFAAIVQKLANYGWTRSLCTEYSDFKELGYLVYDSVVMTTMTYGAYRKSCLVSYDVELNPFEFLNVIQRRQPSTDFSETLPSTNEQQYTPIKKININLNY